MAADEMTVEAEVVRPTSPDQHAVLELRGANDTAVLGHDELRRLGLTVALMRPVQAPNRIAYDIDVDLVTGSVAKQ